ncbi:hypothetical protein DFH09DRAFT_1080207 [Mycena vulgaris]|nr:hypothetical protein DFH09DRAFT_1080207 [Mycena vulgaris]
MSGVAPVASYSPTLSTTASASASASNPTSKADSEHVPSPPGSTANHHPSHSGPLKTQERAASNSSTRMFATLDLTSAPSTAATTPGLPPGARPQGIYAYRRAAQRRAFRGHVCSIACDPACQPCE